MRQLLGGGNQAGIVEVVSAEHGKHFRKHFPRLMDEGLHDLVGVCRLVGAMLSQDCCQSLLLGLSFGAAGSSVPDERPLPAIRNDAPGELAFNAHQFL
jgi:hypothetical protein